MPRITRVITDLMQNTGLQAQKRRLLRSTKGKEKAPRAGLECGQMRGGYGFGVSSQCLNDVTPVEIWN